MMPVEILEWRPVPRNSLRGFATIRLGKNLKIKDIAVHTSHSKRWAQFPSKPLGGTDGELMKVAGKVRYVPILEWLDRDAADNFSASVLAALDDAHPGATE